MRDYRTGIAQADAELVERLRDVQRVCVIGSPGSGKSWFGRKLSQILNIPHYEMDALFFRQNWEPIPYEEFTPKIAAITAQPLWLLDGNYPKANAAKLPNAQLLIWIDMPFWLTMRRLTKRTLQRVLSGSELWEGSGNYETVQNVLSKKSIIRFGINQYPKNKRRFSAFFASNDYPHLWLVRLKTQKETISFLKLAEMAIKTQRD